MVDRFQRFGFAGNDPSKSRVYMKHQSFKFSALVLVTLMLALVSSVHAGTTKVKGYTKKDGTYVAPHSRTTPDKSKQNNYSTKGNMNPHTGKKGTVDPDKK